MTSNFTSFSIDDSLRVPYQSNTPPATRIRYASSLAPPEESPKGIEDEAQPVFEPLHVRYPVVGSSKGSVNVGQLYLEGKGEMLVGIYYSALPLEQFLTFHASTHDIRLRPFFQVQIYSKQHARVEPNTVVKVRCSPPSPLPIRILFVSSATMLKIDASCIGPPMPEHVHRASFPLATFSLTVPWN
jgi:hypothetical protein